MRLDLGPFRALLDALGHPERELDVVLVAGTNGKGSTAALLDSIARAAGLRTGLTTSPHLERVEERIRIDGVEIASGELVRRLTHVFDRARNVGTETPTYFEATIAAAFLAFAEAAVELAIVEVGLGGRLDATNACEPILSVVTPVAFDHRELLGETLGAIAREKGGIFRRGVPAVIAEQAGEADSALAAEAERVGAPLHRVADECRLLAARSRGFAGQRIELATSRNRCSLELPLAGGHQIRNAAAAVVAAELLSERYPSIDRGAIESGVAATRWPGRLELLRFEKKRTRVLLDAAHNPDGCAALARFLDELAAPFDLLFGALADKEVDSMLPPLAARASRVTLTRPDSPRGLDPQRLLELVKESESVVVADPLDALDVALAREPDLLVVCGSIVLIGPLRSALLGAGAHVAPAAKH